MTVMMGVMNRVVFIHALTINSDVPVAGVFQSTGFVMVKMTVEISVMKTIQIAPRKVSISYSPPKSQ